MERRGEKSRSYRDLDVWKLSIELVKEIYQATAKFPPTEIYGLTNQLRRAAISIPSNIAEGQGGISFMAVKQLLDIALGSLAELETQLIISHEIGYLTLDDYDKLSAALDTIRKMIKALANSLK